MTKASRQTLRRGEMVLERELTSLGFWCWLVDSAIDEPAAYGGTFLYPVERCLESSGECQEKETREESVDSAKLTNALPFAFLSSLFIFPLHHSPPFTSPHLVSKSTSPTHLSLVALSSPK